MKFLEGIPHHNIIPFDAIAEAGPRLSTITVWPAESLYGIGLHSRNEDGEVSVERITSGSNPDVNHLSVPVDAAFFSGDRIFPMDLGIISRDRPVNITFVLGDRYRDIEASASVRVRPTLTETGLSINLSRPELEGCLRQIRPVKMRLYIIGSRMPLEHMTQLDDLRWCRQEIGRLRAENQRLWDREYVIKQVRVFNAGVTSAPDTPGPLYPPAQVPFPGNVPGAPPEDDSETYE